MTAILAAEWFAERLPIRFKTWCYQKKSHWSSRISVEGGIIHYDRFVPERELETFLSDSGEWQGSEDRVVLLSGCCGDRQGAAERVSFLIKELRGAGIPTLWGRSGRDAALPPSERNDCPQLDMPIDQAISILPGLCGGGDAEGRHHLILAAPLVPACKYIGRFDAAGWITTYACLDDWSREPRTRWKYDTHAEEFLARSCDFCIAGSSELADHAEAVCAKPASGVVRVTGDRNPNAAPQVTPLPGLLGIPAAEWTAHLERKNLYRLRGDR
jgi:hypothetical protein